MRTQQSGFTLIELVMVIVILGILAAVALPKFADLSSEARYASLQGAYGAAQSALEIVHSQSVALAQGTGATSAALTIEGVTVNVVYGYPQTLGDLAAAANISTANYNTAGSIYPLNATNTTTCSFNYTVPTATTPGALTPAPLPLQTAAGC